MKLNTNPSKNYLICEASNDSVGRYKQKKPMKPAIKTFGKRMIDKRQAV